MKRARADWTPSAAELAERRAAITARWRADALALPQPTRQAFLDAIWAGRTVGEAREAAGMTLEQAMGTMDLNMEHAATLRLRRVSV